MRFVSVVLGVYSEVFEVVTKVVHDVKELRSKLYCCEKLSVLITC